VRARKQEIANGLAAVEAQLVAACNGAGRPRQGVTLIAVSKFKPASDVRLAYELGVRDFGENYVQELVTKQAALADLPDIRWHLIGHLQRNKARAIVEHPPVLHTLDSLRLAEELDRRLAALDTRAQVLLQVNVADETQKAGCSVAEARAVCEGLPRFERLALRGLMLIPPAADDAELSRSHFRRAAELRRELCPEAPELSMGMSQDFVVAIAEGATLVRVGTAIFGVRNVE
jgi:pyridoxal phosphate enzyme (YggS family)